MPVSKHSCTWVHKNSLHESMQALRQPCNSWDVQVFKCSSHVHVPGGVLKLTCHAFTLTWLPVLHAQLIQKRPLSPDVIGLDGKSAHYKFPMPALSSITNRVTGVVLSCGEQRGSGFGRRGAMSAHISALHSPLQWTPSVSQHRQG